MWLLDQDDNLKEKLQVSKPFHRSQLNGANTLTFDCENKVSKYDRILYRDELMHWHEFIVQRVTEDKYQNEVFAEHSSYELHANYIKDIRPTGSPYIHLQRILLGTRWSPGVVEPTDSLFQTYYYQTPRQAIHQLVSAIKAEVQYRIEVSGNRIVGRFVDILHRVGNDLGKRFTYTKDLDNVTRTILEDDIFTALVGRGRGEAIGEGYGRRITFSDLDKPDSPIGFDYVFDSESKDKWGIVTDGVRLHRIGLVEFDDIEDPEVLYEATKERLQQVKEPQINYTCSVVLLKGENVDVGDTVSIIDKDFRGEELRLNGRILEIDRDLLDHTNSTIVLGNLYPGVESETVKLNKTINQFRSKSNVWDRSSIIDEEGNIPSTIIKDLLAAWNSSINLLGGHVYAEEGKGLTTYDKPIDQNPTQAVNILGGAMRIANSKLPNGDWDWRTVSTGDGIVADTITSGRMNASLIKSGLIMSNSGRSYINLDDDSFNFDNSFYKEGDYVYFGSEGDDLQIRVGNGRIAFMSAGTRVAYVEGQNLYIENGTFLKQVIIGAFGFIPRANGNLSLVKVG